jgi:hypothetical protein
MFHTIFYLKVKESVTGAFENKYKDLFTTDSSEVTSALFFTQFFIHYCSGCGFGPTKHHFASFLSISLLYREKRFAKLVTCTNNSWQQEESEGWYKCCLLLPNSDLFSS